MDFAIAFPSPLGVSYFQIQQLDWTISRRFRVSVPSRGILFPNWMERKYIVIDENKGFRPLSGYLISKLLYTLSTAMEALFSFRPLSGYLISKFLRTEGTHAYITVWVFPSPLGVSYFQIILQLD